ncbi:unnamed protein product [Amoebophrya sp. A120]|nr:unnamed protein product [Amoebophrya sp. A120]|eukprot:GSA120T00000836001.1
MKNSGRPRNHNQPPIQDDKRGNYSNAFHLPPNPNRSSHHSACAQRAACGNKISTFTGRRNESLGDHLVARDIVQVNPSEAAQFVTPMATNSSRIERSAKKMPAAPIADHRYGGNKTKTMEDHAPGPRLQNSNLSMQFAQKNHLAMEPKKLLPSRQEDNYEQQVKQFAQQERKNASATQQHLLFREQQAKNNYNEQRRMENNRNQSSRGPALHPGQNPFEQQQSWQASYAPPLGSSTFRTHSAPPEVILQDKKPGTYKKFSKPVKTPFVRHTNNVIQNHEKSLAQRNSHRPRKHLLDHPLVRPWKPNIDNQGNFHPSHRKERPLPRDLTGDNWQDENEVNQCQQHAQAYCEHALGVQASYYIEELGENNMHSVILQLNWFAWRLVDNLCGEVAKNVECGKMWMAAMNLAILEKESDLLYNYPQQKPTLSVAQAQQLRGSGELTTEMKQLAVQQSGPQKYIFGKGSVMTVPANATTNQQKTEMETNKANKGMQIGAPAVKHHHVPVSSSSSAAFQFQGNKGLNNKTGGTMLHQYTSNKGKSDVLVHDQTQLSSSAPGKQANQPKASDVAVGQHQVKHHREAAALSSTHNYYASLDEVLNSLRTEHGVDSNMKRASTTVNNTATSASSTNPPSKKSKTEEGDGGGASGGLQLVASSTTSARPEPREGQSCKPTSTANPTSSRTSTTNAGYPGTTSYTREERAAMEQELQELHQEVTLLTNNADELGWEKMDQKMRENARKQKELRAKLGADATGDD